MLILSRDETIGVVDDLVVCPTTGTIRGFDTEVELSPDEGMPRSCVLNLANTTSAEKAVLTVNGHLVLPGSRRHFSPRPPQIRT